MLYEMFFSLGTIQLLLQTSLEANSMLTISLEEMAKRNMLQVGGVSE